MSNDRRVTAVGKQVLLDGAHLADAVSEDAAKALADALEYWGWSEHQMPPAALNNILRIAQ